MRLDYRLVGTTAVGLGGVPLAFPAVEGCDHRILFGFHSSRSHALRQHELRRNRAAEIANLVSLEDACG